MSDLPNDPTAVDEATEADSDASAIDEGRRGGPVDESDMAAADGLTADEHTSDAYADMLERGAHQEGEGRVDL